MIPTMLPSGGSITGFNPNSGSNDLVDAAVETTRNYNDNIPDVPDKGGSSVSREIDALTALYNLAQTNPEYMETYLQLLAERENTTNAQAWYRHMSDTSYQRAVKDLEKAGLNPALALSGLNGASAGSVQPASTWSTSPYANKINAQNAKTNSQNASTNLLKALLSMGAISVAMLAAFL